MRRSISTITDCRREICKIVMHADIDMVAKNTQEVAIGLACTDLCNLIIRQLLNGKQSLTLGVAYKQKEEGKAQQ